MLLGVNIDHVATLREARRSFEPDIMTAAILAQLGGADGITVHLRQDRRHIQEEDVVILKNGISVPLNVEISLDERTVEFIRTIRPEKVCLVPENPDEITTEGGLNLLSKNIYNKTKNVIKKLHSRDIEVSIFIEPELKIVDLAKNLGADAIEINTKSYSECENIEEIEKEFQRIAECSNYASYKKKLIVNAGHGLNYDNVSPIVEIEEINELNIGHSIIAKSVFYGIEKSVKMMRDLIEKR
ncbi:MAG: pyridoxine 5'-phosphate synthase [bacterium]|uniref:Pyridoxine 5'-phosphate synthase n=2 Tax=Bacteria candidate phyla TaxID=1783234 RepID=A0A101I247_UNCT6|nr:MAG: Pyridoxine 5'-phosphate synthase [candidate division TA06 bacterium 32_111]KUK86999.1 MAG: Pyridoxine 5'-phosphate synthase [candidate division TA06 bacterium 34_109]MDI6701269.1 pyridoxine 5'-phosphate synthase [bacterium]HAF06817.1 pyridoxine 5'-phosphate synthase [candidate division WOR-3 bacterium]HCP17010.1 pyridoxine 5'-phosphate synthase [candidate division WOR-3 bacterium]